jgi:hypothetical protein
MPHCADDTKISLTRRREIMKMCKRRALSFLAK